MTTALATEPWLVLGLDPGSVRIGVARSASPTSSMALALPAIANDEHALGHIAELVAQWQPRLIVVGFPVRLDGSIGAAASRAIAFARSLSEIHRPPVRLLDERLTTVQAQRQLHAAGKDTRASRSVIDSSSAILLVEAVLAGAGGRDPADLD